MIFIPPDAGVRSDEWEEIMKTRYTVALSMIAGAAARRLRSRAREGRLQW
jgi:hypothetical protein